jgi:hypothetical protein
LGEANFRFRRAQVEATLSKLGAQFYGIADVLLNALDALAIARHNETARADIAARRLALARQSGKIELVHPWAVI